MALGWRRNYLRYRSFFMDVYRVYKSRPDIKMFLEILLSLVTVSFFAFFALRPTAFTITELLEEIKSKEEVINQMDTKIANIEIAQQVYNSEGRISLLDDALPDIPSPETFARQLEGLASRSGIIFNSLAMDNIVLIGTRDAVVTQDPEAILLPAGAGEIPFSLNALGNYDQLSSFLDSFESLRRPIKIDNSVIGVAQLESGSILTLSISGRIPFHQSN